MDTEAAVESYYTSICVVCSEELSQHENMHPPCQCGCKV